MTTNTTPAVDAMINGRRADSTRRRQRVLSALDNAIKDGAELSVTSIARAAGVDRTFLYRSPRPARTYPRRRNPTTRRARDRTPGHPRITASRPARRPTTLHPHGRTHPTTRNPPIRAARRTSLARKRTRCPHRHRPTSATHHHTRTTNSRATTATRRTRPRPRRRPRR